MQKICLALLSSLSLLSVASAADPTKVVFLTGDGKYRSEESMPMIAKMLNRDFGFDVSVGFSVDEKGIVDPNAAESLTQTEELADADLMVLFLRYRRPSEADFNRILDYLKAGKPVVAFRTSTHAFRFTRESPFAGWGFQDDVKARHALAGGGLMRDLVGQTWVTHHGHFADGQKPLTSISIDKKSNQHPILRGVEPFEAYSWLYHVDGGAHRLSGKPTLLLHGKSLISNHEKKGNTHLYPLENPVAWTKEHQWGSEPARVFATTLGHPYDFRLPAMRRFAIQGILWALGKENAIPESGVGTDPAGKYEPNNSGFDTKHKMGMKPSDFFELSAVGAAN